MTSPRQRQANLLNALKSTGPITPAGKAASSQNNRKLGLAANIFQVLPDESQEDFDDYAATLQAELHPKTLIEKTLVLKMAQHYWLGQRAVRAQNGCFTYDFGPFVENPSLMKQLALYLRYQAHHDRAFHKCLAELQKLQNEKRKEQSEQRKQAIHEVRLAKSWPQQKQRSIPSLPAAVPAHIETAA